MTEPAAVAAPHDAAVGDGPRTAGGLGWPLADGVPSGGPGLPTSTGAATEAGEDLAGASTTPLGRREASSRLQVHYLIPAYLQYSIIRIRG